MITWMSWRYGILQCWGLQLCIFDRKKVTWGHQRDSEWLKEQLKKQHWQALGHEAFWTNGPPSCFCWSLPMICHIFVTWHGQKLVNISEYPAIHNDKWILFALFSTTQVFILTYGFVFWSFVKWQQPVLTTFQSIKKCSQMAGEISFIIIPCPILCFFVFTQELKLDFEGFSSAQQREIILQALSLLVKSSEDPSVAILLGSSSRFMERICVTWIVAK